MLLEINRLEKRYGDHVALRCVTASIKVGEIVVLLGSNGSGKTTLIKALAGLVEPTSGSMAFGGLEERACDSSRLRGMIGYVPHEPSGWGDRSIRWNLCYRNRLFGDSKRTANLKALKSAEAWQLEPVLDKPLAECSRGWRQRYSLAQATMRNPPILLLDEPTVNLDVQARQMLTSYLKESCAGKAVLIATHEVDWCSSLEYRRIELQ